MNIYYDVEDNHYRTYPDGDIATIDQMRELIENKNLSIAKWQQENKQLKEIYKDLFNTYQKLKKENEEVTLLNLHQVDKIQQLKDNWNKLKEYANKMHEYFLYTDVNEIYKQNMKEGNPFPNLFNLSELNASDKVLNSICKKMQELEQGSDSNVKD